jgi:pyruvate/2-oxoglutarate dehydrogenase complex dihydrolipoamide dehydrogenase (E3) component
VTVADTPGPRGGGGRSEVDVVVLGLGPGGTSAASDLAKAGLSVVGVDERLVGGECPFYGCTPTKMMVRAADLLAEARRVPGMAGASLVTADWAVVASRIADEATHGWDDADGVKALTADGVTFVRGHGRLAGPGAVSVGDDTFVARRGIVLATGTSPAIPPVDGLEATPYWTNRDIVAVDQLPGSAIVIGGGTIGVELCQVLARFGVSVTLLEVADTIMAQEEPEASALLTEVFAREGIQVLTGATIDRVDYADRHFSVLVDGRTLSADKLLVLAGRRTNLADIGLETVGLDPAAEALQTDGHLSVADGLWAIGDVTGEGAYTHLAHYQAEIAVDAILRGTSGRAAEYRAVPRITFTDPEVGAVGLTQQQAQDQGIDVLVGVADVAESSRGWVHKSGNQGFVKVVADATRHVLVGATVAGPMGGEILAVLSLAVHAQIPVTSLETMIYAFPSLHETVKSAVLDLQPPS